jgi:SAM-dependent methyltransferase
VLLSLPAPSAWLLRWAHLIAPGGSVLDVASGSGRNTRWLLKQKHAVTAVDSAALAIESIANEFPDLSCEAVLADIENGPWPFVGRQFDAVLVCNYLHRPLLPTLLSSLKSGGVLMMETFAQGNETVGKPSRPDFLLRPGELLAACTGLRVVAFEDGFEASGDATIDAVSSGSFRQKIVAVRAPGQPPGSLPQRYFLAPNRQQVAG